MSNTTSELASLNHSNEVGPAVGSHGHLIYTRNLVFRTIMYLIPDTLSRLLANYCDRNGLFDDCPSERVASWQLPVRIRP